MLVVIVWIIHEFVHNKIISKKTKGSFQLHWVHWGILIP